MFQELLQCLRLAFSGSFPDSSKLLVGKFGVRDGELVTRQYITWVPFTYKGVEQCSPPQSVMVIMSIDACHVWGWGSRSRLRMKRPLVFSLLLWTIFYQISHCCSCRAFIVQQRNMIIHLTTWIHLSWAVLISERAFWSLDRTKYQIMPIYLCSVHVCKMQNPWTSPYHSKKNGVKPAWISFKIWQ